MLDILIHNGLVVTVDDQFTVLTNGAVAVRQGRIERVWTPDAVAALPPARETLDARAGMIMPGLVNTHTHLPMALFRGLADDLPLQQWLNEHIFPAEAQHITPQSVVTGAQLACAEMLLNGTTTCCDGYFLVEHFAQAVVQTGIQAVLGQGVIDFPAPGVPDPARNVELAKAFVDQLKSRSSRIQPSIFCHSPYTCSANTLRAAKQAAKELGVLFQIHVAESRTEFDHIKSEHNCSPIQYLESLGVLDETTLLVHAVWIDAHDMEIIARCNTPVVHCPESNMKLASGIAPVPEMLARGIIVGLGTDGCASNNDLDLFGEMDMAAKLHKVKHHDPTLMDAASVVRMATMGGAKALGLDQHIGSLESGKQADLIILAADQPHLTPVYHPASHLVYSARGADVQHVMINGKWVVRKRRLLTLDVAAVMQEVHQLSDKITDKIAAP